MAEHMIYVISGIVGVIVGRFCFQRNTKNRSRRNRTESSILNTLLHSPMRQQRSIVLRRFCVKYTRPHQLFRMIGTILNMSRIAQCAVRPWRSVSANYA